MNTSNVHRPNGASARPFAYRLIVGLVTALAVLGASAIALFGAWVGSTLAVFHGGPIWLALVGAFACFFLVPLAWELLADRHQVGGRVRDAILRSSVLSLVLIVVLLMTHTSSTFKALATRGDWFLAGSRTPAAESIRGFLQRSADRLEWLHNLARTNYGDQADDPAQVANDQSAPSAQAASKTTMAPGGAVVPPEGTRVITPQRQPDTSASSEEAGYGRDHVGQMTRFAIPQSDLTWPLPAELHPAVREMPEEARVSVAAVGRYLAAAENDPLLRVKAIHDFVATWVRYDDAGLVSGDYKKAGKQSATRVFKDRTGVCAGFANLTAALGKAAGVRVIYITGDARNPSDYSALGRDEVKRPDAGHAWNAAEVNGTWYLVDTTWDAGPVDAKKDGDGYRTTYLFIPPELIRLTHLPDAPKWQLLKDPMDRGTWWRQPLIRPSAAPFGLSLNQPQNPIVAASDTISFDLDNPGKVWVIAELEGSQTRCGPWVPSPDKAFPCEIGPLEKRTALNLFAATSHEDSFGYIGGVLVEPD